MSGLIKTVPPYRQKLIMGLACEGLSAVQVGDKLGQHETTIERWFWVMYRIYGAKNKTQLVHIWHRDGIFNDATKIKTTYENNTIRSNSQLPSTNGKEHHADASVH